MSPSAPICPKCGSTCPEGSPGGLCPKCALSAAAALGMSSGAVKVAIHRLRQQFSEAVRQEISQTLDEADSIEDELRYLIQALS